MITCEVDLTKLDEITFCAVPERIWPPMGMFPAGSVRAQAASGLSLRIRHIIQSGTLAW
jgi:hypothetical protein